MWQRCGKSLFGMTDRQNLQEALKQIMMYFRAIAPLLDQVDVLLSDLESLICGRDH
jgi:hypothetical protein